MQTLIQALDKITTETSFLLIMGMAGAVLFLIRYISVISKWDEAIHCGFAYTHGIFTGADFYAATIEDDKKLEPAENPERISNETFLAFPKVKLGEEGTAYIDIPANGTSNGFIQVLADGHLQILTAKTRGEEIPTFSKIKVVETSPHLIVVRVESPALVVKKKQRKSYLKLMVQNVTRVMRPKNELV